MGTILFSLIFAIALAPFFYLLQTLLYLSNFGFFTYLPHVLVTAFLYLSAWSLYWFLLFFLFSLYIVVVGAYRNGSTAFMMLQFDSSEAIYESTQIASSPLGIILLLLFTFVFPVLMFASSGIMFLLFATNHYPYHRGAPCSSWPRVCC